MEQKNRSVAQQEARIRRGFQFSLLALLIMVGVGGFVYWLGKGKPTAEQSRQFPEAVIAPTAAQQPPGSPPAIRFTDITRQAGIDFVHFNGATGQRLLPETMGSGGLFFDYDRDGDQDIFLVNFNHWPDNPRSPEPTSRLYQNDGQGHFTDVSRLAGLDLTTHGMGAAAGDYNGDGWPDLYLYTLYKNHLLENRQGRFVDVTRQAGVGGSPREWSSGATFFDYDQDGDLDLLVTNYVHWSPSIDLEIDFRLSGLGRAYGAPTHFEGARNHLYRNDGDGHFTEVSKAAGLQVNNDQGAPVGKALGLSLIDYDLDGDLDIFIANDTARNFLFNNLGHGKFEETGIYDGIAYSSSGKSTGAMGIDTAWIYNNDDVAVAIGNFANEMTSFYVSPGGHPPFTDEAVISGIGPESRLALTFGMLFFDVDLDGRLDILQANGHLEPEINKVQSSQHFAQRPQLFWNSGQTDTKPFIRIENAGDLDTPLVGRASAYADIDNDGDLDVLITQNGRAAKLLRNDQQTGHHWLRIQLKDKAGNPDAIGARIELTVNGQTQRRQVTPNRGYLSQVELIQTFGLGEHERVDSLKIFWPDGSVQTVPVEKIDRTIIVHHKAAQ